MAIFHMHTHAPIDYVDCQECWHLFGSILDTEDLTPNKRLALHLSIDLSCALHPCSSWTTHDYLLARVRGLIETLLESMQHAEFVALYPVLTTEVLETLDAFLQDIQDSPSLSRKAKLAFFYELERIVFREDSSLSHRTFPETPPAVKAFYHARYRIRDRDLSFAGGFAWARRHLDTKTVIEKLSDKISDVYWTTRFPWRPKNPCEYWDHWKKYYGTYQDQSLHLSVLRSLTYAVILRHVLYEPCAHLSGRAPPLWLSPSILFYHAPQYAACKISLC